MLHGNKLVTLFKKLWTGKSFCRTVIYVTFFIYVKCCTKTCCFWIQASNFCDNVAYVILFVTVTWVTMICLNSGKYVFIIVMFYICNIVFPTILFVCIHVVFNRIIHVTVFYTKKSIDLNSGEHVVIHVMLIYM